MEDFLAHVVSGTNYATGRKGTPVDFLSFHAKGSPRFVDGHVRLGISSQLGGIDRGFSMFAAVPELKDKPIVIGESDPDGCAACQGPQLGYRTGPVYGSYTAACIAREFQLADKHGVNIEGALTWAFEFEDQPFFAGQRVLATNGIDLPVLNVFRMLSRMDGQRVEVTSSSEVPLATIIREGVRGAPDVAALAAIQPGKLAILAWHYHDDDVPGPEARVELNVAGLPLARGAVRLTHYRVDDDHSNPFAVWKRMGSPAAPDAGQYAELEKAGQLAKLAGAPETVAVDGGAAALGFLLPREAVSLLVLEWDPPAK
jgi:xylan 1,4-beta-xylosidase